MRDLESIFHDALTRTDSAEQRAYVEQACGGDTELLRELIELLQAHRQSGDFLELNDPHRAGHANILPTHNDAIDTVLTPIQTNGPTTDSFPQIPGFHIDRVLGKGGLGIAYLARDLKLDRQVVIKVLAIDHTETNRTRLLQEARKAATLHDPAIVTVYSVDDTSASPAIVMELVEGFPVDRVTAKLTFPQKGQILQEIARAIGVAHRHGIIHRDLKPENVIVTPDLRPKVLDFGLAISLEEAAASKRFFEGTPRYASPEQVLGQPLTTASDVFSFGVLMFKVLTGRTPFDGSSTAEVLEAICRSEPPFLRDVALGVPEDLQAICLACLARQPADRPSIHDVTLEVGRYLAGEPVRLRPALYSDILRRRIAVYSNELTHWERQGMISNDERDRLQTVHRRILADEDHWIIDARKVSVAQTILYTSTWLVVVSAALLVWLVRDALPQTLRWAAPLSASFWLLAAGLTGSRRREPLASASFLAGAVLSLVPTTLSLLWEFKWLIGMPANVTALLPDSFSNAQIFCSSTMALLVSCMAWSRLQMTGFAWTSAVLGVASYVACLLCVDWLGQEVEIMAAWCLPLSLFVAVGLWAEKIGRVRWALPFHLIAMIALVTMLDIIAWHGPTLGMLGWTTELFPFLNEDRQRSFSLALNGYLFLGLMLMTERSRSLDLRRASHVFEPMAMLHILGALYANVQTHRESPHVLMDVYLYVGSVLLLLTIGPWRSRWRLLVGALGGLALASHVFIDLGLVPKSKFVIALGTASLVTSAITYVYLLVAPRR